MMRRGETSDIDAIMQLEVKAFKTNRLSRRSMLYMMKNPQALFWVAEDQGALMGYAIVLKHNRARLARLYSLAIAAEFRGKGVADKLLNGLERACFKPGIKLEVREDNIAAQRLYARRGYTHIGRRDNFYSDGTPAILMQKLF